MASDSPHSESEPGRGPGGPSGFFRGWKTKGVVLAVAVVIGGYFAGPALYRGIILSSSPQQRESSPELAADSLILSDKQASAISTSPVEYRDFRIEKTAVGSIDFNQDTAAQVFPNYQGKIIAVFANIGDTVKEGQTLFTIDSPDLLTAESTLIQAAGVLQLTNRALARTQKLVKLTGAAEKDLDQAISDQQTADGNLRAARNALYIFGKDDMEIDRIITTRQVDSTLSVPSPTNGVIATRNAAPGLFVQPGTAPAPFTVADVSTMWMNAYVVESEIPSFTLGQEVEASVAAYPDRGFQGKITRIGELVDPATRRLLVRSEISDPERLLRPGMFATFIIRTGKSLDSPAIPLGGIVREGDGTMSAWITKDGRVFSRRTVQIGLQQNGYDQILSGVKIGEVAVTDGAIFLSNILAGGSSD